MNHELLTALVGDKAEPGVLPEELLRRLYGARPNEEFVRDKWKVLLERWLPEEPTARDGVVTSLRSRDIGDLSIDVSTPAGSLEYLSALRNTSGLRAIVLREVIHAGELPKVDLPEPSPEAGQPASGGIARASDEAEDRDDQDDTRSDEDEQPAWPWTTLLEPAGEAVDLGPPALARLVELWESDEEWLTSTPRHLRWWPFPIPVDLGASEQRLMYGDPTVKIEVGVRLLEGAGIDRSTAAALMAAANMYASAAAVWFDPDDGSVHVTTTVYAHEGNESVLRLYSALSLIGVIEASLRARGLAEACGAELLIEPHPVTGIREGTDEILEFVATKVLPAGRQKNAFETYDFEAVAASLNNIGIATGGPTGLTAEFPVGSPGDVVPDEAAGPLGLGPTYMYQQMTNTPHPSYGGGLFCLLSVPLDDDVDEDEVFLLANRLNRGEATQLTGFPAWGAWVPHASNRAWLAHVAFIPSLLADPGVPGTLCFHAFLRSHWVNEQLQAVL